MKKTLALLLAFSIILSGTVTTVPLFGEDETIVEKIENGKAFNGNPDDEELLMNDQTISITDIMNYLITDLGNSAKAANNKYVLNPYVYQKYKVIAYTTENAVNKKIAGLDSIGGYAKDHTSGTKEYRYLGFDRLGVDKITNDFYPADSKTVSDPTTRTWIPNDEKLKSWGQYSNGSNYNMLNYLLKTDLMNDDDKSGEFKVVNYSVSSLVHSNNWNELMSYAKLMADPGFGTVGTMQLAHISGGKKWYDTVRKQAFTYDFTSEIETETLKRVSPGTETYTINYTVRPEITNIVTDGGSLSGKYFFGVQVNSQGITHDVFENVNGGDKVLGDLSISLTKEADLRGMQPGESRRFEVESISTVDTPKGASRVDRKTKTVVIEMVDEDTTDFVIKKNLTDITDRKTELDSLDFTTPLTLTLQDTSLIMSGNVTSRQWSVMTPTGWKLFDGGNNETTPYTINETTKENVIDGKIEFRLNVQTDSGVIMPRITYHYAAFEEKSSGGSSGDVVAVIRSNADWNEDEEYYEAFEGEVVTHKGNDSYHNMDLEIVDYDFEIGEDFGEAVLVKDKDNRVDCFYPDSDGGTKYKAYLTVTDEVGAEDTDKLRIKINPAVFDPIITVGGHLKENRKVTISMKNKKRLEYYPVDESSLIWTITPLDGQGDVIRVDGSLTGSKTFDALFKKYGRYDIKVEGYLHSNYNTKRVYGEKTERIYISKDLEPSADIVVSKLMLRDIDNNNMTLIEAHDRSESIDNDTIVQRVWSYKYDSDNDQDFDDEPSFVIDSGNSDAVSILSDKVGRYKFEVQVKEEFGQPTIGSFITDLDKRRSDTSEKPAEEKVTLLDNVAPVVEIDATNRKAVNALILNDLDDLEKISLESSIEELRMKLLQKKLNLNIEYIQPTVDLGEKDYSKVYYDTYITIPVSYDGWDEDGETWGTDYIRLLLYSQESYGAFDPLQSQKGRFEIVSATMSDSEYSGPKYNTDRIGKAFQQYRNLELKYKDNGVLRYKTYKYTTDFYYFTKYSNIDRELDIGEIKVGTPSLTVDYANTGNINYNRFNSNYTIDDYIHLMADYGRDYDTVTKDLRTFNKAEMLEKFESMEGDTYFVSLLKNSEGLLGLDSELVNYTATNEIKYRAGENGFLKNNMLNFNGLSDLKVVNGKIYLIANGEVFLFDESKNIFAYYDSANSFLNPPMPTFIGGAGSYNQKRLRGWYDQGKSYFYNRVEYDYYTKKIKYDDGYEFIESKYPTSPSSYTTPFIDKNGVLRISPIRIKLAKDWSWSDYESPSTNVKPAYGRMWIDDTDLETLGSGFKSYYNNGYVNNSGQIIFFKPATVDKKYDYDEDRDREESKRHGRYYEYTYEEDYSVTKTERAHFTISEGYNNISYMRESNDDYYVYTKDKKVVRYNKITGRRTLITDGYISLNIGDEVVKLGNNSYKYRERQLDNVKTVKVYDDVVYSLDNNGVLYRDGVQQATDVKALAGYDSKGVVYLSNNSELTYPNGTISNVSSAAYNDNYLFVVYNDGSMKYASNSDFSFSRDISKIGMDLTGSIPTENLTSSTDLLNLSSNNKYYPTTNEVIDSIYADYEDYASGDKMYVILNESVDISTTMLDYEDDPIYELRIDSEHSDPNYFENGLGEDPNVGVGVDIDTFNYTGIYRLKPRGRDNPVGDDDRFDSFRKWNEDNTYLDVYVHRRPFAQMKLSYGENGEYLTVTARDNGSYDIDHLSEEEKGIINWEWSIKKVSDINWHTERGKSFTYDQIEPGEPYIIALRVQDKEHAWSNVIKQDIQIADIPISIAAKLRAKNPKFMINALPTTEYFEVYDIETEYPNEIQLELALYDGDSRVGMMTTVPFNEGVTAVTDTENSNLKRWFTKNIQAITSVEDGPYKLRITATDITKSTKSDYIEFDVVIKTPFNLTGFVNGSSSDATLYLGDNSLITAVTSKYVNELDVEILGSVVSMDSVEIVDDVQNWTATVFVEESVGELTNNATFSAETINNRIGTYANGGMMDVDFTTRVPLEITGSITPNPCLAGERVTITCNTKGRGERVVVDFENVEPSRSIELEARDVSYPDENVFVGTYIIPMETDDGTYDVKATVYRDSAFGTKSAETEMELIVKGNMFQLVKPRIIESN